MNTRYPIGPEYIPDYREFYMNGNITVPAGTVRELSGEIHANAIHVEGQLRFSQSMPTTLYCSNLLIYKTGELWCGNDGNSMLQNVRIVIKDEPIDTELDPYQWGRVLMALNGGQLIMCGKEKLGWGTMQEAVPAGMNQSQTITLDFEPNGWQVGDELLFTDTREVTSTNQPRREPTIKIAAIMGRVLVLDRGLTFEHLNAYVPNRNVFVSPCVGNITRNIRVESQNPFGTRGHSAIVEMMSMAMVCHTAFIDLGRTRAENIDRTTADAAGKITHVGTNQIARYCFHLHHLHSSPKTEITANVFINTGNAKWGGVCHQSSDTLWEDNISLGFVGAGFITEDGNEIRNRLKHNLAAYILGNGKSGKENMAAPNNNPGAEGAGHWFHGNGNEADDNRADNCATGFQAMFRVFPLGLKIASIVGGMPNTDFVPELALPVSFTGNVAVANKIVGFESWNQPPGWIGTGLRSANNGTFQAVLGNAEAGSIKLVDCWLIGQNGIAHGLHTDAAYALTVEVEGGFIRGCLTGVRSAMTLMSLKNVTLQNVTNVDEYTIRSPNYIEENVIDEQFGSFPKRFRVKGYGMVYHEGQSYPPARPGDTAYTQWAPHNGRRSRLKNWQGLGVNYILCELNQLSNTDAWHSTGKFSEQLDGFLYMCPESGLTMGECMAKYGLAYGGGVVDPADVVHLDGLINCVAKVDNGSPQVPTVPRCVLSYPNMLEPAHANGVPVTTGIYFNLVLTGTPSDAGYRIQIDDLPPKNGGWGFQDFGGGMIRFATTDGVSPGLHTLRTWRLDSMNNVIPGSEGVYHYPVGTVPPAEIWLPANDDIGPPINDDAGQRVRTGRLQKKQS